ncbi:Phosphatidylinositol N-acetylglucosaminyltransferase subunit P like [Actinidia chinensis var. chinensis]|uniref:Phosphatidylinositol N-acetylglucosaminyltransferase subunit P like n=1 Tax=Actinidia chinensis var. chinensis TaxID=1590841 RepID=A0A2R6QZN3_ACTCC|nr:Phosphatidylinositol N-acetylglucosaminyltransferase subunit P like [Actinidia chinensis var. chinensis]
MEDQRSVNSPRRVLSLSRKRRGILSSPEPGDKAAVFGPSGDHGPKPSEVYGFVGAISTVVATVIFLIWAYVPEPWLHHIGIFYYPSRYWALAVPTYVMVTMVLAIGFYIGLNFMVTPPPTSLNTIFDEHSREPSRFEPSVEGDEQPIEPLSDIGINQINDLMFNDQK